MATDIRNPNPGVWAVSGPQDVYQLGPDSTYGDLEYGGAPAEQANGNVLDWIFENGDDAINVIDSVLCTINPNRPGCRPQGNGGAYVVQSPQNNTLLIIVILLVLLVILVLIFKK